MAFKLKDVLIHKNQRCETGKKGRTNRFPCSKELYAQIMANGRLSTLKMGTPIDPRALQAKPTFVGGQILTECVLDARRDEWPQWPRYQAL